MNTKEQYQKQIKRYRAPFLLMAVGLCVIMVFFHCSPEEKKPGRAPNQHPHILLITIDTLRADHLSIYGYKQHRTPNIHRLGSQGAVFDSAYCDVNWTTPSMASTLTGTFANRHGLRSMYQHLPASVTTVAELLKTAGYNTGAVIGAFPLDSVYCLDQGFDVYDDTFSGPIYVGSTQPSRDMPDTWGETVNERKQLFFSRIINKSRRSDSEVTAAAVNLLKQLTQKPGPFFLWVHYFGPHAVPDVRLNQVENWKNQVATYAAKVVNADKEVGNLLSALDSLQLSEKTLVIFHADHGESLGEHGFVGHGVYLYEDNLRIPLILRWPGEIPAGQRVPALVGNVDIAATTAAAAGLPEETYKHMDGKSLLPVINQGKSTHETLYFETYLCAHDTHAEILEIEKGKRLRVGVRSYGMLRKPWKYIKTGFYPLFDAPEALQTLNKPMFQKIQTQVERQQLFQLEKDPRELISMAQTPSGQAIVQDLARLLAAFTAQNQTDQKNRMKLTEEQLEKLKSLGYIE